MAISNKKKTEIFTLLQCGDSIRTVAKKTKISTKTINKLKIEAEQVLGTYKKPQKLVTRERNKREQQDKEIKEQEQKPKEQTEVKEIIKEGIAEALQIVLKSKNPKACANVFGNTLKFMTELAKIKKNDR